MIRGEFFIGSREVCGRETYRAHDAATGAALEPPFHVASIAEVDRACELAAGAFDSFRETSVDERARFLEMIADNIADVGDELIVRAMSETGLPRPRLEGERARTVGQLRLVAAIVRQAIEQRLDWDAFEDILHKGKRCAATCCSASTAAADRSGPLQLILPSITDQLSRSGT